MKTLYLIRHGSCEKKEANAPDMGRKLTKPGSHEIKKLGKKLLEISAFPDRIITSPAARAYESSLIVSKELGFPREKIEIEKSLYENGSIAGVTSYLEGLSDDVQSLYIIGHNPMITELASLLSESFDKVIPKAGIIGIEIPIDSWHKIKEKRGNVKYYDYPENSKDLKKQLAENITYQVFQNLSELFAEKSRESVKYMRPYIMKTSKDISKEFVKSLEKKREKIRKNKTWFMDTEKTEKTEK